MNNSKTSIIIPVYKAEKYLNRCIDSIINQSYKNIEIILVNDGSPDNCPAICDEYAKKDGRIKVIHKENGGVSSARNAGLDVATGKYIQFVDSDDWVEPEYSKSMIKLIEKKHSDLGICGYTIVRQNRKIERCTVSQSFEINSQNVKSLFNLHCNELLISPVNKIYKLELLRGLRFNKDISLTEDAIFNYAYLTKCANICVTDALLYTYFNNNESSLTKNFKPTYFKNLKDVYISIIEFYKSFGISKDIYDSIEALKAEFIHSVFGVIRMLSKNKKMSSKQKIKIMKEYFSDEYFKFCEKTRHRNSKVKYALLLKKFKLYRFLLWLFGLYKVK